MEFGFKEFMSFVAWQDSAALPENSGNSHSHTQACYQALEKCLQQWPFDGMKLMILTAVFKVELGIHVGSCHEIERALNECMAAGSSCGSVTN